MTSPQAELLAERVLVLAPTGRDAALASAVLGGEQFFVRQCADVQELCRELARGAGAILIAEEALWHPTATCLTEAIGAQETWSDIPLVVFSSGAATAAASQRTIAKLAPLGNVTLLERPVRIITLVSSLRAALRARRRQYQVRDLLAQLERGVHDRDRFLAMLSHELRNPLAAILYAAEVLNRFAAHDERLSTQRSTIERQVRHLSRLVDDLLDVSRVTSGKIKLSCAPVNLVGLVQQCVDAMIAPNRAQGVEITCVADPGPITVLGDSVRLDQVVMNLLANALKYTPEGGRVTVSVERRAGHAVVAVEDNGVGIAKEMLPRIFELFTQVDSSLARSRGGLGIGLTLVRSLVELHGGTVTAESAGLGRGSRFAVSLPVVAAESPQPGPTEARAPAPVVGRRIVIIEDNDDVRECLQLLLEDSGHRVAVAADGPSGVDAVLAQKPEVVLIDVGLPGLDGYEVARAIRAALGRSVYLIAATGYGRPEDQKRALDVGFDAHLTKPVTVESVEKLLRRTRAATGAD